VLTDESSSTGGFGADDDSGINDRCCIPE